MHELYFSAPAFMMRRVLLFILMLQVSNGFSQSLHPLEPPTNHYIDLKELDPAPNPENSALDTIKFVPKNYNTVALLYTMLSPVYLTPAQVESLKKSVMFPANSSEQTRAELDFLLNWQEKRTKADKIRTAEVLAPIGYWPHIDVKKNHPGFEENMRHLFFEGRTVLGEDCSAVNYPATTKLLRGLTTDMRIMEFTVKYHLLRARPYVLEPKLKPLQIMGSPSFASGHTLWAYIHAFAWSELVPRKRNEFLKLAYEIGESREIMGIHYPSDEEAARLLAHRMLKSMLSNPEFIADFQKAKLEWKK